VSREVSAAEAKSLVHDGAEIAFLDLREAGEFGEGHVAGALWGIRPRLGRLGLDPAQPVYLIGAEEVTAPTARDLAALGLAAVFTVAGGQVALAAAGAAIEASPDSPTAEEAIDFLFFVHDRHDGNLEASRRYLAWEQGLIAQLDAAERAAFALSDRLV
jgi:rhodanese-related sulfurtransferase